MSPPGTKYNIICVIGHTAGGKTAFAARVAHRVNGEIISADSRQVYRRMDLGTGKDYDEYIVEGTGIPHHLVDIREPGDEYNVYEYQKDFLKAYGDIINRGRIPVLCGGSGLYIEAVLKGYHLISVPVNPELRKELEQKEMGELTSLLASFRTLHNVTDTENRKRMLRALEIEYYYRDHPQPDEDYPELLPFIAGIKFDRNSRRQRISDRLYERLEKGMVKEVESLLEEGIPPEKLIYYGLEYRYIAEFLTGRLKYEEMVPKLETAIHQFAKRQMTWFRGMEGRGLRIFWLDGQTPTEAMLRSFFHFYRA